MEIWDVYDIYRNKKNYTMIRGDEIKEGDFHLVVHVCIFNSKGEMLIQQRQPFKHGFPNHWDLTIGGSASEGELPQEAAERELFEELGLKYDFKGVRPYFTVNFNAGFDDYFLIEKDVKISELTFQEEEVQSAKWASKDEILEMIDSGEFIPYYKSLILMIFEMKRYIGSRGSIIEKE